MRLEEIVQPRCAGAFFAGHVQASAQSVNKLQNRCCFRLEDGFHQNLAGRIKNHRRDRCLMDIQPNILSVIHGGAPSCVGLGANDQNLLQRAPFYNALLRRWAQPCYKSSVERPRQMEAAMVFLEENAGPDDRSDV